MTVDGMLFRNGVNGRHVLAMLVGFFATILAVNGVFLYVALSTHTGVVANEPYRKGLHYNDRIEADAAQQRLGWQTEVAELTAERVVQITVKDRSGYPIPSLAAAAVLGRPATRQHDVRLELVEKTPGVYTAKAAGIESGAWQLDVELTKSQTGDVYRLRRRMWLKP